MASTWLPTIFLITVITAQADISNFFEDISNSPTSDFDHAETNSKYEKACRGELKKSPKEVAKLKCRYINNNSDFLKIAPIKFEEAHKHPLIAIFHDVISDEEIKILQDFAGPKLKEAVVVDANTGKIFVSKDRVGNTSKFVDDEHILLETLSQRARDMTQLDTTSASTWFVIRYDVGGYFKLHHDYVLNPNIYKERGQRLATVLLYLNDDFEGGFTGFPIFDVSYKPQKGSALVWFNLFENGEPNVNTIHGGCSVTKGKKWMGIKILHVQGQNHKCGLQKRKFWFKVVQ